MSDTRHPRARPRETSQQQRAARIHAANRARIESEREAMARRSFVPYHRRSVVGLPASAPEDRLAVAFTAIGVDYGGRMEQVSPRARSS